MLCRHRLHRSHRQRGSHEIRRQRPAPSPHAAVSPAHAPRSAVEAGPRGPAGRAGTQADATAVATLQPKVATLEGEGSVPCRPRSPASLVAAKPYGCRASTSSWTAAPAAQTHRSAAWATSSPATTEVPASRRGRTTWSSGTGRRVRATAAWWPGPRTRLELPWPARTPAAWSRLVLYAARAR